MRVAFELEKEKLRMHDGALGKTLEILFVFKGSSGILPSRVSLEDIQREMANLCHRILW